MPVCVYCGEKITYDYPCCTFCGRPIPGLKRIELPKKARGSKTLISPKALR